MAEAVLRNVCPAREFDALVRSQMPPSRAFGGEPEVRQRQGVSLYAEPDDRTGRYRANEAMVSESLTPMHVADMHLDQAAGQDCASILSSSPVCRGITGSFARKVIVCDFLMADTITLKHLVLVFIERRTHRLHLAGIVAELTGSMSGSAGPGPGHVELGIRMEALRFLFRDRMPSRHAGHLQDGEAAILTELY